MSTPARLKASDVARRSRQLSGGERKSGCQGWFTGLLKGVEAALDKVPRVLGRDGGASVKLS
jgi:hypothetical protein